MPFELNVDHSRKRIYSRASGEIGPTEIFEATMKTLQDPTLKGYNELMDARGVEKIDFSGEQSYDLASVVKNIDVPRGRRFAVVVTTEFHTGMVNQYSSFLGTLTGDRIKVAVFTDFDEAETWAFEGGA
ncbi:MAG: hypothetical protein ACYTFG_01720 [Planctomycetota bacterium]|jgi:hypothetical protein